jgi:hypothetical protein
VTVPGLPASGNEARLTINVDGAFTLNEATGDVGLSTGTERVFGVGGADPTPPSTPEAANVNTVRMAMHLALGLESYVGVLPAGLTVEDDLMPRVLQAAQAVRALQIEDPVVFQQAISADVDSAYQVLEQVVGPSATPVQGADAMLDLAGKAAAAAG